MSLRLPPAALAALLIAGPAFAQNPSDPSFNLVNRGTTPIREIYVTPGGDPNWGRNRLHGTVPPGGTFPVRRKPDGNCILDIKVVFENRQTEERRGLNTCTLDAVAVGGPERTLVKDQNDPSFRLINRGPDAIRELYVTPSGTAGWGRNRLPADGLPAGAATVVRIAHGDQCLFDMRVVFADHKALEQRRTDLCRITDVPVP